MQFYAVASTGFVTGRGKAYRAIVQTGKFGLFEDEVAVVIREGLIRR